MANPASSLRKPREQKSEQPQSEAHHLNTKKADFHKDEKWDKEDSGNVFKKRRMDALTEHLGATSYFANMRWTWFGWQPYGVWQAFEVSRYYQEKKLALDIGVNQAPMIIEQKKALLEKNGIKYYVIKSAYDLKNFTELNI